jgi:hypothetical protein
MTSLSLCTKLRERIQNPFKLAGAITLVSTES